MDQTLNSRPKIFSDRAGAQIFTGLTDLGLTETTQIDTPMATHI